MSTAEELEWEADYEMAIEASEKDDSQAVSENPYGEAIGQLAASESGKSPYGTCYHTKWDGCPPCIHDAYWEGYRQGYNDHARARAFAEAIYGPYGKNNGWPDGTLVSLHTADTSVFNQHGSGENP